MAILFPAVHKRLREVSGQLRPRGGHPAALRRTFRHRAADRDQYRGTRLGRQSGLADPWRGGDLRRLEDVRRDDAPAVGLVVVVEQRGREAVEAVVDEVGRRREVRRATGKFVNERTKRRPMIVPVVMET